VTTFAPGQVVWVRFRRSKEWIPATYVKATECFGVTGWHLVTITGDGEPVDVPAARIRKARP
jgi:hypothetical protein